MQASPSDAAQFAGFYPGEMVIRNGVCARVFAAIPSEVPAGFVPIEYDEPGSCRLTVHPSELQSLARVPKLRRFD